MASEHSLFARVAAPTSVEKLISWIYSFTWKHLQQLLVLCELRSSVHSYIIGHASSL